MQDRGNSVWQAAYSEARCAYPGVALGLAEFVAHAAKVGAPDPPTTPTTTKTATKTATTTATTYGCELFLACACAAGDPRAIVVLERDYLPGTRASLARFASSSDFVDEVLQELRAKLLLGPEPRIALYGARGPLLAWIRVAASRVAIDLLRSSASANPRDPAAVSADPMTGVDLGPEVQLLRNVYRESFRDALASSLNALSAQDRNLLRRHLLDRLTLQEIAAPYGVHPATIARRLTSLRESIADSVRKTLGARHRESGGSTSLESLAHAIRSEIDLSLSPLLSGSHPSSWPSPSSSPSSPPPPPRGPGSSGPRGGG